MLNKTHDRQAVGWCVAVAMLGSPAQKSPLILPSSFSLLPSLPISLFLPSSLSFSLPPFLSSVTGFSLYSPDWFRTFFVAQASLELQQSSCLCLWSTGITDMHHRAQPWIPHVCGSCSCVQPPLACLSCLSSLWWNSQLSVKEQM